MGDRLSITEERPSRKDAAEEGRKKGNEHIKLHVVND
jgi:hypothetical protein